MSTLLAFLNDHLKVNINEWLYDARTLKKSLEILCRPSGHGDTYSFKIKKKGMPLLFPESMIYNL